MMTMSVLDIDSFISSYPKIADSKKWRVILFYKQCLHCKAHLSYIEQSLKDESFVPYAQRLDNSTVPLTIDHIIPLSLGGTWKYSNLQVLCQPCNLKKGNDSESDHYHITPDDIPADFLEQIISRKSRTFEDYPEWKPYYGF